MNQSIDALRTRFGFPPALFDVAVRAVIERYVTELEVTAGDESPVRRFVEGSMPLIVRSLDLRRGQVLPRGAAPEVIGEHMHRWTYAVFLAALLRGDVHSMRGNASSAIYSRAQCAHDDRALSVILRCVPPNIYAWLRNGERVLNELQVYLSGTGKEGANAIGEIVEAAAIDVPHSVAKVHASARTGGVDSHAARPMALSRLAVRIADDSEAGDLEMARAGAVPTRAGARTEVLGPRLSGEAKRFIEWTAAGVSDGSLTFNAPRSAIHFVAEGMLLVSPAIFHLYGAQVYPDVGLDDKVPSQLRRARSRAVQAALLGAGKGVCVGPCRYRLQSAEHADRLLTGVVVVRPDRYIARLPRMNAALVRVEHDPARG